MTLTFTVGHLLKVERLLYRGSCFTGGLEQGQEGGARPEEKGTAHGEHGLGALGGGDTQTSTDAKVQVQEKYSV